MNSTLAIRAAEIRQEIKKVIVGQETLVEKTLIALFAGGHVILEGVPGLAKTLFARALAASLHVSFKRIQFTPDLMPSDLIGTNVFQPDLRRHSAGGRDQPHAAENAIGLVGGDGGISGHGRRHFASVAGTFLCHRHPKSDRVRGHVSVARGADRSFSLQDQGRLPHARR
jgi:MoxR-like ATPase